MDKTIDLTLSAYDIAMLLGLIEMGRTHESHEIDDWTTNVKERIWSAINEEH